MTENVGELQDLQARMMRLVDARNAIIDEAEAMIDRANQEFDEVALELGKAINRARELSKPAKATETKPRRRTQRRKKEPEMEGLTDEEKAMYRQLLVGRK